MTKINRPDPPPAPLCVLLVEDNKLNQQVLCLLLEKSGFQVEVASNGMEALELFERRRFDLVLMDLQMPEMDGLRATRLIRAREKAVGGRVPIVAVTANALDVERQHCLAAGMDDYLSKPVRGSELFPTIARVVAGRAQDRPATLPLPADPEQADWQTCLLAMGFDQEAVARLAEVFIDTVPSRVANLRQALSEGNLASAQKTAHSLKGSLAVFGAKNAVDTAARLEQVGRGLPAELASTVLADLEAEIGPMVASMRACVEKLS
jgi:CheY-like chemotaxis protein